MTAPGALVDIFVVILLTSLLSFGGGNGYIPVIQARWIEVGLLDPALFSFVLGLSYLTPGPKSGFIAGVGYYLAGIPGAVVAAVAVVIPTCLGAAGVSYAARSMAKIVSLVTPSSGFILAGLIAAAAWGTAAPMDLGPPHVAGIVIVAVLVMWREIDPIWVVLTAVAVGGAWSAVNALA